MLAPEGDGHHERAPGLMHNGLPCLKGMCSQRRALTSAEKGLPAMCCPWKVTDTEYTPAAVAEKAPPYSPVPVSSICTRARATLEHVIRFHFVKFDYDNFPSVPALEPRGGVHEFALPSVNSDWDAQSELINRRSAHSSTCLQTKPCKFDPQNGQTISALGASRCQSSVNNLRRILETRFVSTASIPKRF